ncbi:MAG TPA: hypothetical protein VG692_01380 [Gemmatimonadales bacterium]|nr:hypothetical protein [Gemmatimonadales bacterium]
MAPDFLAVLDVTEAPDRYGELVTTLPVPGRHNVPHHTEHELPADRQLFANGFGTGETFVFDLTTPRRPRLAYQFNDLAGLTHPHSFVRLPGGNVLATFQMAHSGAGMRPGGLVEMTPSGTVRRSASADQVGIDSGTRVYSAAVIPTLDRIVTTTTDMMEDFPASNQLQIWRLSDLSLQHTIKLPPGPRGDEGQLTAEPRVLADGKTVLVSTFNCGLYLLQDLDGAAPSARMVASFPMKERTHCAIPVVAGSYYLVTVPAWSAVVSLDISDPSHPREVGRAVLGPDDVPHWIALAPDHRRVVVTGYGAMRNRVVLLQFDPQTGSLAIDIRFREPGATTPGYLMSGKTWPHGGTAAGVPHGAVFSRP